MAYLFPPPIQILPIADVPFSGAEVHLSQAENHQILFMTFTKDIDLPEHQHAAQWGMVLAGKIDLIIAGEAHTFSRGDTYYIPANVLHSGKIYAGYSDITYFDQPDRYAIKNPEPPITCSPS